MIPKEIHMVRVRLYYVNNAVIIVDKSIERIGINQLLNENV